ncbi:peptidase M23-like protein [Kordia periserrulae]|uniref:Peptidase M23-like protein n=1 Tax=Kordia periserrulae TaxID=701523 RepID=A0A2T6C2U0_9FLAO|nr:M23 family metallopeptidase [Kordia periserrulae]PTX62639.1 peptidase M23-like protein [Kordia periserrulae]
MYRLFYIFLLFFSFAFSQQKINTPDFRSPLDIPIILSGTFGELRSNHFHSGIDIKTKQKEGFEVFAIGDGYVSRIKIQHWGFGKALYVTHSSGHTSVYAHLKKLSPKLEAYLKKQQYAKESYEIQLYPKPSELTVKKGEVIAYSGNSGSSGGPHLHFEIRDANSKPMNPMLFGIDVKDSHHPTVNGVFAYALSKDAQVNASDNMVQLQLQKGKKNHSYIASKVYASGEIGFGINSYDRQDLAFNKNGVYQVESFVDGKKNFSYTFNKFAFSESRYINALIDYARFKTLKQRIQRCFLLPSNKLSIYKNVVNNGRVLVEEGKEYTIVLKVKDFKNNMTTITIPVVGKKQNVTQQKKEIVTNHLITQNAEHSLKEGDVSVYIPKNTFYEDFYFDLSKDKDGRYIIHNENVPAHKNITISFDVSKYSAEERKKLFIASLDRKNKPSYSTTKKKDTKFTTSTKSLGTYFLVKDSIPPTVKPVNFANDKWISNKKQLKVKISDDLSGIRSFRGTINGKWILFEYDPKKDLLTYDFDDVNFTEAKHNLKLIVTDNVGNNTTFTSTFYRKTKN